MIEKYSIKITNELITNAIIEKEKSEEYIYGLKILIEKFIAYSVLLMVAYFLKLLIPSIIFMGFFLTLRKSTGGYHSNTYLGCFFGTLALYLFCSKVLASFLLAIGNYIFIVLTIMCVFILFLSPVNHPNLNLTSDEVRRCKARTKKVLIVELIFIIIFTYFRINTVYVIFATMGIIVCAVLLIIAKVIKQEVKENEEHIKTSCSEIN